MSHLPRRSAHTTSKATAQQLFAGFLDEHRRLYRGCEIPAEPTKESLEGFTYDYSPTLKPRTQERYRTSFRQLNAVFGNLYLDEITGGRLADYASDRMKLIPVQKSPFAYCRPKLTFHHHFHGQVWRIQNHPVFRHTSTTGGWVGRAGME